MFSNCTHFTVWAEHKFAAPRCLICDPPAPGQQHVKGVLRGDKLLTAGDIADEIEQTNAAAIAGRLQGWKPGKRVESVPAQSLPSQKLIGNEFPAIESEPPPKGVVATPGMGFWRDQSVVDAARAEYEAWLERQPKPAKITGAAKVNPDRYVSPVKQEQAIEFV